MAPSTLPGLADPLRWLLGDQCARFLSDSYEQRAIVARHGEPARFRGLLSIADIDRIVAEHDLKRGMLMLADSARRLEESAFVSPSGAIDRAAVAHHYQLGATIILNQLQESDGDMAALCRALEKLFSCHVQTNTYLTPPSSQGFRTHYDNHDVFVIQIEGEKTWTLYDRPVAAPYRGEQFEPGAGRPVGEPAEVFVLKAGDCAYVPRGLLHDAATTGDQPSLHITCGLIVRTWADLMLEAISQVCVEDPAFRRSLPPDFARPDFDRTRLAAPFEALVQRLSSQASPDNALNLAIQDFIASREPDVSGAIAGAHAPLAASYAARPSIWRIEEEQVDGAPGVRLVSSTVNQSFPGLSRGDLERMMSGEPFGPGDLEGSGGQKVLRQLVAAGMIAAIPPKRAIQVQPAE